MTCQRSAGDQQTRVLGALASVLRWSRWQGRVLVFLVAVLASTAVLAAPRVVRVGVYDNPPKIQAGPQGQPSGILGDLLVEMARQEQWTIEPVACDWEQCLQQLESGAIDLLPDVAYNEERAQRFDFHRIPALPSWSLLYRRPDVTLQSVLDLDHKRVAVLEGSVQQSHLAGMLSSFGLNAELLPAKTFDEAFAMVVCWRRFTSDQAVSFRSASTTRGQEPSPPHRAGRTQDERTGRMRPANPSCA